MNLPSNRPLSQSILSWTALFACFMIVASMAHASLTPPGPPDETMKPLDHVEPRTPISAVPVTINESGSYYLTRNLEDLGGGITITADDVTLDLMGFTMKSAGGSTGVSVASPTNTPLQNVVVRNGGFRGFSWGVRINNAENCRLEDLFVADNTAGGIRMDIASGHRISGLVIKDCRVSGNGFHGIEAIVPVDAVFQGNQIVGCIIQENDSSGIRLFASGGSLLENSIENCLVARNSSGISVFTNVASATIFGNNIINCRVMDHSSTGISLIGVNGALVRGSRIIDNHVARSVTAGINLTATQDNLVDGNHVSDTEGDPSLGIRSIISGGNIIVRNVCTNNTTNYLLAVSEDTFGPIVTTTGALANTGDASHPWANFSR